MVVKNTLRGEKMKKFIFSLLSLLFFSAAIPIHAQDNLLAVKREEIIALYQKGITQTYSYEEVEAYIASQEVDALQNGVKHFDEYVGPDYSTGHGVSLGDYLEHYVAANGTTTQMYPYAVDFSKYQGDFQFFKSYNDTEPSFYVTVTGNQATITTTVPTSFGLNNFSIFLNNYPTVEESVLDEFGNQRNVKINTSFGSSVDGVPHRTDYRFSFFYNRDGGISLLMYDIANREMPLQEYKTK